MGRRRPELTRNKRGTPVYSKEDIREQYCINEKEVHVLERINARSIFNCFSERDPSPCKKQSGSLLTSCYKRRRKAEPAEDETRPLPRPRSTWQDADDDADAEFFRRRPRVFCYTDPKRFTWTEGDVPRGARPGRPRSPGPGRHPNQLPLRELPQHCRHPNGGNDVDRAALTQPSTPDLASARWRHGSQEAQLGDRQQQKHVSFDAHIFRSQTMSSIDGEACGARRQPPTPSGRPLNRSQERLLDGRRTPDYINDGSNVFGTFLTRALLQEKMKRASMRTQSTQTDIHAMAAEPAPPSYLSLSPRTAHRRMRSQGMQTPGRGQAHRALTKSFSEVGRRPSQLRRRSPPDEPGMNRAVSSPDGVNPPAVSSAETSAVSGFSTASVRGSELTSDRLSEADGFGDRESRPTSEQEIMINYQPYAGDRMHPLQKTLSEGQILLDRKERERLEAVCVEAHGSARDNVIEQLTVSESDLLEPSSGRLRALAQAQRAEAELETPDSDVPPPPPPRDYDDDEFHENLIENLLCEAVPRAESPSSCSETSACEQAAVVRDALSPPRSTLTRDSLTESQETVLAAVGSGGEDGSAPQPPLPLPSDSEAGTPGTGPEAEHVLRDGRSVLNAGSDSGSQGSNPADVEYIQRRAEEPENGAPSSASASGSSLAREEGLVLRQLDAICTELDNRLASPEELSRLSPPPPSVEWKDCSPAPSYVSSVSEGDDEKKIEKFMLTLNEGFESDTSDKRMSGPPCAPFSSLPRTLNGKSAQTIAKPAPMGPSKSKSSDSSSARQRVSRPPSGTDRPPSTVSQSSDRTSDIIYPPSRVESLSSISSVPVGSGSRKDASLSTPADASDASARSDTSSGQRRSAGASSPRKRAGNENIKRYSRYFEENESGQLVEVDAPGTLAPTPSPDRSKEGTPVNKPGTRRQLSKQYSVDVPQAGRRGMCLDLPASATMYRTADQCAVEQRFEKLQAAEEKAEAVGGADRKRTDKIIRNVRLDLSEVVMGESDSLPKQKNVTGRGEIVACLDSSNVGLSDADVLRKGSPNRSVSNPDTEKMSEKDAVLEAAPNEGNEHYSKVGENNVVDPASTGPTEMEKRWSQKGAGATSGMVRSPAMHEGFRHEDWSVVRTPQTPEKIIEVKEELTGLVKASTDSTRKPHKEKKKKKRSKERNADGSRHESSSRSRERDKDKEKSKKRSSKSPSKRRSTVPDPYLAEESVRSLDKRDDAKPAVSSSDLRVDAAGMSFLSAKPSAESLRSVSQGSDSVFMASSPEAGASADVPLVSVGEQRQARLGAISSELPECVQCSSCGEKMRASSRERSPLQQNHVVQTTLLPADGKQSREAGQEYHEIGKDVEEVVSGNRTKDNKQDRQGSVDRAQSVTQGDVSAKERHKSGDVSKERVSEGRKRESKKWKRLSAEVQVSPSKDMKKSPPKKEATPETRPSPARGVDTQTLIVVTKESSTESAATDHLEATSKKRSSARPSEGTPIREGEPSRRREPSRGSSRRRRGDKERVMSEERVLDARPVMETRAKSEERYTRDPTGSSHHSQDSLSRPTDASTQSLISMRDLHEEESGVYAGHFPAARWLYIGIDEELKVWRKRPRREATPEPGSLTRSVSTESTESEREFRKRYQAVSHRMVHRKSSGRMFQQVEEKTFASDKSVVMQKCSGEFGFRIHGSRPVVVSAIEPGTPAEISGLEVGDIIISINGCSVLESSHGDVVKIAHAGSDELRLEVASTSSVLPLPESWSSVREGALWRRSDSSGSWCLRWAVLKSDASLYLFKRAEDVHPVCGLSLAEATVTATSDCGREMAFVVKLEGATEPVTLAADSEEEFTGWMEALRTVVHESSAGQASMTSRAGRGTSVVCMRGTAWTTEPCHSPLRLCAESGGRHTAATQTESPAGGGATADVSGLSAQTENEEVGLCGTAADEAAGEPPGPGPDGGIDGVSNIVPEPVSDLRHGGLGAGKVQECCTPLVSLSALYVGECSGNDTMHSAVEEVPVEPGDCFIKNVPPETRTCKPEADTLNEGIVVQKHDEEKLEIRPPLEVSLDVVDEFIPVGNNVAKRIDDPLDCEESLRCQQSEIPTICVDSEPDWESAVIEAGQVCVKILEARELDGNTPVDSTGESPLEPHMDCGEAVRPRAETEASLHEDASFCTAVADATAGSLPSRLVRGSVTTASCGTSRNVGQLSSWEQSERFDSCVGSESAAQYTESDKSLESNEMQLEGNHLSVHSAAISNQAGYFSSTESQEHYLNPTSMDYGVTRESPECIEIASNCQDMANQPCESDSETGEELATSEHHWEDHSVSNSNRDASDEHEEIKEAAGESPQDDLGSPNANTASPRADFSFAPIHCASVGSAVSSPAVEVASFSSAGEAGPAAAASTPVSARDDRRQPGGERCSPCGHVDHNRRDREGGAGHVRSDVSEVGALSPEEVEDNESCCEVEELVGDVSNGESHLKENQEKDVANGDDCEYVVDEPDSSDFEINEAEEDVWDSHRAEAGRQHKAKPHTNNDCTLSGDRVKGYDENNKVVSEGEAQETHDLGVGGSASPDGVGRVHWPSESGANGEDVGGRSSPSGEQVSLVITEAIDTSSELCPHYLVKEPGEAVSVNAVYNPLGEDDDDPAADHASAVKSESLRENDSNGSTEEFPANASGSCDRISAIPEEEMSSNAQHEPKREERIIGTLVYVDNDANAIHAQEDDTHEVRTAPSASLMEDGGSSAVSDDGYQADNSAVNYDSVDDVSFSQGLETRLVREAGGVDSAAHHGLVSSESEDAGSPVRAVFPAESSRGRRRSRRSSLRSSAVAESDPDGYDQSESSSDGVRRAGSPDGVKALSIELSDTDYDASDVPAVIPVKLTNARHEDAVIGSAEALKSEIDLTGRLDLDHAPEVSELCSEVAIVTAQAQSVALGVTNCNGASRHAALSEAAGHVLHFKTGNVDTRVLDTNDPGEINLKLDDLHGDESKQSSAECSLYVSSCNTDCSNWHQTNSPSKNGAKDFSVGTAAPPESPVGDQLVDEDGHASAEVSVCQETPSEVSINPERDTDHFHDAVHDTNTPGAFSEGGRLTSRHDPLIPDDLRDEPQSPRPEHPSDAQSKFSHEQEDVVGHKIAMTINMSLSLNQNDVDDGDDEDITSSVSRLFCELFPTPDWSELNVNPSSAPPEDELGGGEEVAMKVPSSDALEFVSSEEDMVSARDGACARSETTAPSYVTCRSSLSAEALMSEDGLAETVQDGVVRTDAVCEDIANCESSDDPGTVSAQVSHTIHGEICQLRVNERQECETYEHDTTGFSPGPTLRGDSAGWETDNEVWMSSSEEATRGASESGQIRNGALACSTTEAGDVVGTADSPVKLPCSEHDRESMMSSEDTQTELPNEENVSYSQTCEQVGLLGLICEKDVTKVSCLAQDRDNVVPVELEQVGFSHGECRLADYLCGKGVELDPMECEEDVEIYGPREEFGCTENTCVKDFHLEVLNEECAPVKEPHVEDIEVDCVSDKEDHFGPSFERHHVEALLKDRGEAHLQIADNSSSCHPSEESDQVALKFDKDAPEGDSYQDVQGDLIYQGSQESDSPLQGCDYAEGHLEEDNQMNFPGEERDTEEQMHIEDSLVNVLLEEDGLLDQPCGENLSVEVSGQQDGKVSEWHQKMNPSQVCCEENDEEDPRCESYASAADAYGSDLKMELDGTEGDYRMDLSHAGNACAEASCDRDDRGEPSSDSDTSAEESPENFTQTDMVCEGCEPMSLAHDEHHPYEDSSKSSQSCNPSDEFAPAKGFQTEDDDADLMAINEHHEDLSLEEHFTSDSFCDEDCELDREFVDDNCACDPCQDYFPAGLSGERGVSSEDPSKNISQGNMIDQADVQEGLLGEECSSEDHFSSHSSVNIKRQKYASAHRSCESNDLVCESCESVDCTEQQLVKGVQDDMACEEGSEMSLLYTGTPGDIYPDSQEDLPIEYSAPSEECSVECVQENQVLEDGAQLDLSREEQLREEDGHDDMRNEEDASSRDSCEEVVLNVALHDRNASENLHGKDMQGNLMHEEDGKESLAPDELITEVVSEEQDRMDHCLGEKDMTAARVCVGDVQEDSPHDKDEQVDSYLSASELPEPDVGGDLVVGERDEVNQGLEQVTGIEDQAEESREECNRGCGRGEERDLPEEPCMAGANFESDSATGSYFNPKKNFHSEGPGKLKDLFQDVSLEEVKPSHEAQEKQEVSPSHDTSEPDPRLYDVTDDDAPEEGECLEKSYFSTGINQRNTTGTATNVSKGNDDEEDCSFVTALNFEPCDNAEEWGHECAQICSGKHEPGQDDIRCLPSAYVSQDKAENVDSDHEEADSENLIGQEMSGQVTAEMKVDWAKPEDGIEEMNAKEFVPTQTNSEAEVNSSSFSQGKHKGSPNSKYHTEVKPEDQKDVARENVGIAVLGICSKDEDVLCHEPDVNISACVQSRTSELDLPAHHENQSASRISYEERNGEEDTFSTSELHKESEFEYRIRGPSHHQEETDDKGHNSNWEGHGLGDGEHDQYGPFESEDDETAASRDEVGTPRTQNAEDSPGLCSTSYRQGGSNQDCHQDVHESGGCDEFLGSVCVESASVDDVSDRETSLLVKDGDQASINTGPELDLEEVLMVRCSIGHTSHQSALLSEPDNNIEAVMKECMGEVGMRVHSPSSNEQPSAKRRSLFDELVLLAEQSRGAAATVENSGEMCSSENLAEGLVKEGDVEGHHPNGVSPHPSTSFDEKHDEESSEKPVLDASSDEASATNVCVDRGECADQSDAPNISPEDGLSAWQTVHDTALHKFYDPVMMTAVFTPPIERAVDGKELNMGDEPSLVWSLDNDISTANQLLETTSRSEDSPEGDDSRKSLFSDSGCGQYNLSNVCRRSVDGSGLGPPQNVGVEDSRTPKSCPEEKCLPECSHDCSDDTCESCQQMEGAEIERNVVMCENDPLGKAELEECITDVRKDSECNETFESCLGLVDEALSAAFSAEAARALHNETGESSNHTGNAQEEIVSTAERSFKSCFDIPDECSMTPEPDTEEAKSAGFGAVYDDAHAHHTVSSYPFSVESSPAKGLRAPDGLVTAEPAPPARFETPLVLARSPPSSKGLSNASPERTSSNATNTPAEALQTPASVAPSPADAATVLGDGVTVSDEAGGEPVDLSATPTEAGAVPREGATLPQECRGWSTPRSQRKSRDEMPVQCAQS